MKIKNKIIFVFIIIVINIFYVVSYAKATDEENVINEVINSENVSEQNNVTKTQQEKNSEEEKNEQENNNEKEQKNEKENNTETENKKNEEENAKENNQKIETISQNNQKKEIKSKSISFKYEHTGNLNSTQYIRKKSNNKSKKIINIKKNKKVKILSEKNGFYKIEYKKGKKKYKGYIKKKYISLNTNISIKEGNTKTLNPIQKPSNSTDKVKYKSSNKKIAVVNPSGVITAIRKGKVKITATTESGKTDYIVIKVKENTNLNKKAHTIANMYDNVKKIIYGKSVLGEDLEAYEIKGSGNNSKVMFIESAVHGFEDEYPKDAKVIVKLANDLVEYYAKNPSKLKDYTFVIIPCVNPDGTLYGKNNYRANKKNAFGRCTYKGIDINRDFDKKRFKAKESRALKKLMKKYSDRIKVNIDLHGWEDSVLGDKKIVKAFRKYVGNKKDKSGLYGGKNAFVISYTNKKLKAHSALVEFKNSRSVKTKNVEKAINAVVELY